MIYFDKGAAMHRNDLDRHLDNMDDMKKMEIMSEDRQRLAGRHHLLTKLIALAVILLAASILIQRFVLN